MTEPRRKHGVGDSLIGRAQVMKRRFVVCAALSVPVMVVSMVPALQFVGWQWVIAAATTIVVTWGAWPFHITALRAAAHRTSTMDTLVSLGVTAAYLWSMWALVAGGAGELGMTMSMALLPRFAGDAHPHLYFEGAAMVVTFLLAGRYAEARTRYRAGDALRALLSLGAKTAHRVRHGGGIDEVSVDALAVGDTVVVKPGEKIPVDGIVERGSAAIDASMMTGESTPVSVTVGDEVTGATINTDGYLTVRVRRVGADTTLARIGDMVTRAQAGKAPIQRLADRIASVFVPIVIAIAIVTAIGWLIHGSGMNVALTAAVSVLVIACPCALGLATPTALLVGSGRAAQLGIVIKGPEILESTRQVDTVVLDKTGTVTTGVMSVTRVVGERAGLNAAALIEAGSSHPVARAIVAEVSNRESREHSDREDTQATSELRPPVGSPVHDFRNHAGEGVSAIVGEIRYFVGSPTWIRGLGFDLSTWDNVIGDARSRGETIVVVARHHRGSSIADDEISSCESSPMSDETTSEPLGEIIDIAVGGMTCAACVRRVERKLEKIPGVTASVNLATDSAEVRVDYPVEDATLIAAIENAGYTAEVTARRTLPNPAHSSYPRDLQHGAPIGDTDDTETERSAELPGEGGEVLTIIAVTDTVKPTSAAAVREFVSLGITPVLLTGDHRGAAHTVAREVGIDHVFAEVLPGNKRDVVEQLQGEGKVVAMVGDGVNDAAALAQAGVRGLGMAMGSGSEVAIEAADITLIGSDLRSAVTAIRISRQTLRVIKSNLFWAFAYNIMAIPLAVAGMLNPMIAGAAMACSSVFVVMNSLRLRHAGNQ